MCLPKSQNTSVLVAVFILFILYRSWHLSLTSPDFPIVYTTTTSSSSSSKQPKLSSNQPTHKKDENEKTDFPKKIWFKLGSKGLSEEAIAWTGSCIHKNPGYAAEYLTDETADAWVQNTFAYRPDLVETFLALQIPIIKADWLRYLLLYAEGGVWSDLDVSCNAPFDTWIPPQYHSDNVSLVVGWEFDTAWPGVAEADVPHELATWTVLAKPGSPHLLAALDGLLDDVWAVARENGVDVAGITATPPMMGDIVTFCGPRRMTRTIFQSLRQQQHMVDLSDEAFRAIEASTHFLQAPKLVGDVLILPGFELARTMNFYSDNITDSLGPPLVEHHYAGSWKNEKGGEF